ncbi:unnamed protein product [Echinostoma caproni]|uniref:CAP-Gly domain-containing protein n=1 Tax=Echinostoma caproni TaxID=27848 RepID=A0A183A5V7_9TREM|nr:unnamed protein product [Echinostoma caproni]
MANLDPNNIGEDWLKVSEARYDSMKHLLQSVKQDIDALTQKIDSTQKSPVLQRATYPQSQTSSRIDEAQCITNAAQPTGSLLTQTQTPPTSTTIKPSLYQPNQPDLLANVHQSTSTTTAIKTDTEFPELDEMEEYMDIRIRKERNPFSFAQNLIDCNVASLISSDLPGSDSAGDGENKTWRSPSDFSLRDPFEEEQLNQEFHNQTNILNSSGPSGLQMQMKETDLDDVEPGPFDRGNESDGSLSPAVSPTFEIYAAETVQLKDMLLSNEETVALGLKPEEPLEKNTAVEDYQVYENGHSLTTIDEASEEVEDDWSSSELDSSLDSNDDKRDHMAARHSSKRSTDGESPAKKAINNSFKSAETPSDQPHDEILSCQSRTATLKKEEIPKPEENFVFDSSETKLLEVNQKTVEAVVLRPKRIDAEAASPNKQRHSQRPTSMGSLRSTLKQIEKSPTGSLHSVISAFSQESMISEADSYVTVCSRFATTGSDDIYTTACSDSELPVSPGRVGGSADDECLTLSRKRTKLARDQRSRARERRVDRLSSSSSNSSIEEQESPLTPEGDRHEHEQRADETLIRTPQALIVTPKFSRLPSKLASPNDISHNADDGNHPVDQVLIDRDSTSQFVGKSMFA